MPTMPSMDSTVPQAPPEASNAVPDTDATKRDATNGDSGAQEPPPKKTRLEEPSDTNGGEKSSRDKGIAPIKAEYDLPLLFTIAAMD